MWITSVENMYVRVNNIWMLIIQFLILWLLLVVYFIGIFLYQMFDLYLGSIFFVCHLVVPTVLIAAWQFFTFLSVRVF